LLSKYKSYQDDLLYRVYITDTAYSYMREKMLPDRFIDVLCPKPEIEMDGDEIAFRILEKMKGE